jgi:pimeloyl-ACP methyl ester carboxylesterase
MGLPKTLALILATTAILASCGGQATPLAGDMVSVGSHSLQVRLEGQGAPTVVIDAGITDQMDKLRPLQERLARDTRVLTYNRAGYGRSDAGPLPRSAAREANELKVLLERASPPGPYVLVGHSLGALTVQVFASEHPGDVAGIVLLDPPPLSFIQRRDYAELSAMAERMTAEWQGIADSAAKSGDPQERARSAFFGMIASEHREMFGETARRVGAISAFGDIPLVVIAAGKPNPAFGDGAEAFQKYWVEQSRAVAGKSTKGTFVLAEDASHYVYLDAPDLVAETILAVVRDARAKAKTTP